MSNEEISNFLGRSKTAILATNGPDGFPHAAGMWFVGEGGFLKMWTNAKSQKARNLQRDARCAVVIEEGEAYEDLRGVLVQGRARIISEFDGIARIGRSIYERYVEPQTGISYEAGARDVIEHQARKRVGVVLLLENVSSWDHSKLTGPSPGGGYG